MSRTCSARNKSPSRIRMTPKIIGPRFAEGGPGGGGAQGRYGAGSGARSGGADGVGGDVAGAAAAGSCEPEPDPDGAAGSGSVVMSGSVPGGLGQLVLDRPEGRLRPRREAQLAEDVRDVGPGGPLRDEEGRADLLVAHP